MASKQNVDLKEVINLLKTHDLQEIEYKDDKKTIRVTAKMTLQAPNTPPLHPETTTQKIDQSPASSPKTQPELVVNAPIVGTVYLTPSPDEAPFVRQGQKIRNGQTVCLIEAMKTFNHIQADTDAKIVDILVKNGETVEFGQTLFTLEKL